MEQWQLDMAQRAYEGASPGYELTRIAVITFDPNTGVIHIRKRQPHEQGKYGRECRSIHAQNK